MRLLLGLIAVSTMLVPTSLIAQNLDVEGRVNKLEKEMRAVQRQVFPNGAGKYFEPEIKAEEPRSPVLQPSSSAVTDLIARVDALESQLATLTGQVETQANSMRGIEARLKSLENDLKAQAAAREAATETAPAASATPAAATKPAAKSADAARLAAVAAIEKPDTGDAFEDSYNYGYRLWNEKFYPEAQIQLQETVDKFPKHARLSYARNLLGRAWLDDGKPATAVRIFYDNYLNDKNGARAPDSLYFLALSLTELKKTKEACESLGQLELAYPGEAAGRLADRIAAARTTAKCK